MAQILLFFPHYFHVILIKVIVKCAGLIQKRTLM